MLKVRIIFRCIIALISCIDNYMHVRTNVRAWVSTCVSVQPAEHPKSHILYKNTYCVYKVDAISDLKSRHVRKFPETIKAATKTTTKKKGQ